MNEFSVVNPKTRIWGLLFTCLLGISLALTLLPSIHSFYTFLEPFIPAHPFGDPKLLEMSLFCSASALLYLSIPEKFRSSSDVSSSLKSILPSFFIPILIAFLFGWIQRHQFLVMSQNRVRDLFWFTVCIPIGEELLFRGWLWALMQALFKKQFFSLTNPLPIELVLSSFAFSLWHTQNYGHVSLGFLVFQLLYTLLTGFWLGYVRWKTGKILVSTLAHTSINLAASLPMIL